MSLANCLSFLFFLYFWLHCVSIQQAGAAFVVVSSLSGLKGLELGPVDVSPGLLALWQWTAPNSAEPMSSPWGLMAGDSSHWTTREGPVFLSWECLLPIQWFSEVVICSVSPKARGHLTRRSLLQTDGPHALSPCLENLMHRHNNNFKSYLRRMKDSANQPVGVLRSPKTKASRVGDS